MLKYLELVDLLLSHQFRFQYNSKAFRNVNVQCVASFLSYFYKDNLNHILAPMLYCI